MWLVNAKKDYSLRVNCTHVVIIDSPMTRCYITMLSDPFKGQDVACSLTR